MKPLYKDVFFWMCILALLQMITGAFVSHIFFISGCFIGLFTLLWKSISLLLEIKSIVTLSAFDIVEAQSQLQELKTREEMMRASLQKKNNEMLAGMVKQCLKGNIRKCIIRNLR